MSKYTTAGSGSHFFRSRKIVWQMVRETLGGHYRMSLMTTIIVLFSIAYVVYPYDLIPDRIPVLGWLDDALVVGLLLWRLAVESKRFIRSKAMGRKG